MVVWLFIPDTDLLDVASSALQMAVKLHQIRSAFESICSVALRIVSYFDMFLYLNQEAKEVKKLHQKNRPGEMMLRRPAIITDYSE